MSESSIEMRLNPAAECSESAADKDARHLEAALRDVIWRLEYVRGLLEELAGPPRPEELVDLLDTSDLPAVLGLDGEEPKAAAQPSDRRCL